MSHQKLACSHCKVRPGLYIGQTRQDGEVKFCGAHCLKLYQIGEDRDVRGDINPIVDGLVNSVSPEGTVPYPDKDAGTIGDVHVRLAFFLLGKDTITGSYNDFARDMRDGFMDKAREKGYDLTIPTKVQRDRLMEQRVNARAAADQMKNLYLEWEDADSKAAYVREVAGPMYEGLRVTRGDDETGTFLFLLFDPLTAESVRKAREMKQDGTDPNCEPDMEDDLSNFFDEVQEAFFEAARQDHEIGIGLPSILKKAITPGRPYSPDTIADNIVRIYLNPFCASRNMPYDQQGPFIETQTKAYISQVMALVRQQTIFDSNKAQRQWDMLMDILFMRVSEKATSEPTKSFKRFLMKSPPKDAGALTLKSCNPAPKAPQTTELKKQLVMLYLAYYPTTEGATAKGDVKLEERRKNINADMTKIASSIASKLDKESMKYVAYLITQMMFQPQN